jgi:2-C-methyl-D-erythritol 4-phosphate cytidylyltransferase
VTERAGRSYQLIAVDVDGTLLDSAHTLRPRVRGAVRAARARGIQVALATGKLLRSVGTLVAELDLAGPQITCNGAAIMDAGGGPPLALWPLAGAALGLALGAIREADPAIGIAWYTADAIYTDAEAGELDWVLDAYHEPALIHVSTLGAGVPTPTKLLVTGTPGRLAALREAVARRLAGRVQVVTTTPDFLEFLSPEADKGRALGAVMRRLGIPRAGVLALGDGENDLPLLAAAGTGVAMGNAVAALRERARYRTVSNDEDGVAVVIEGVLSPAPSGGPPPPVGDPRPQPLSREERGAERAHPRPLRAHNHAPLREERGGGAARARAAKGRNRGRRGGHAEESGELSEAECAVAGHTVAVVLGAGQGTRMGGERNKVFLPLGGVPILARAIGIFERSPLVDEVLVVAHPAEVEECRDLAPRFGLLKVGAVVAGGATRHQSEERALEALRPRIAAGEVAMVLIHDGARPFVGEDEMARLLAAAREVGAALLATPLDMDELVLEADGDGVVTHVFPTGEIWRAQTPQAFAAGRLLAAYDAARREGFEGTDTASALERLGERVRVVPGEAGNVKITTPDDLARAEAVVGGTGAAVGGGG